MRSQRQTRVRSRLALTAGVMLACSMPCGASLAQPDGTEGSAAPAQPPDLVPGVSVTRALPAGETARYRLPVEAGEVMVVQIDQGGLDLRVVHRDPDGKTVTIDSPLLRDEREVLLIAGAATGPHFIELRSYEFTDTVAQPRLQALRLDPTRNGLQISAYRAMMTGASLAPAPHETDWEQALAAYREAADTWRRLGDRRNEAWALYSIAGLDYWKLYNWQGAASAAEAAATGYRALDDQALYAGARHLQAAAIMEAANEARQGGEGQDGATQLDKADQLFDDVLQIQIQAGLAFDQALTRNNQGLSAYYRARWDLARRHWSEAAAMFREQGEWEHELGALANIGVASFETGRLREAVTTYSRVLDILPPDSMTDLRAVTLDNRGQAYFDLDDHEQALADFGAALAIHEQLGEVKGQGRSLSGIALIYYALGDLEAASEYFNRALLLRTQTKDGRGRASTARSLGDVERQLGNLGRAEELHRLSFALSSSPKERANANVALARDLHAADRSRESLAPLNAAIDLAEGAGLERVYASALLERGHAFLELGELEAAVRDLDQALALYRRLELADGQASALHMLARIAAMEERWAAAVELIRQSIQRVETLRGGVPFPELRATFLSQRRAPYELYVDLMMRQAEVAPDALRNDYIGKALGAAELARSRAFVDLVNEAALDVALGGDPELLDRQRLLYQQLSEAVYRRDRALDSPGGDRISPDPDVRDEMQRIETNLQLLEARLRRTNDRYAALTDPQILDASEIQALLGADEILIQFSLGDLRSFVWFVARDAIRVRELPDRGAIERIARPAYKKLRVYQPDRPSRRERDARIAELAEQLFGAEADFSPYKRILVAADGILQFIPFAVLPVAQPDGERRALITSHEIVGVPSMSALALNRRIATSDETPGRALAVFADPVFSTDDPRLADATTTAGDTRSETTAGNELRASADWPRLPYTALEAELIASLAPDDGTLVATGTAANRVAAMDAALGSYRYVHFATHGRIDTRYPALSALALSSVDGAGQRLDGLLQARDISRLTLNAELVVLSACDTALGREIRGESLLGLTQSFFVAGADQVLASLWPVPDQGTANLMEELYLRLLKRRQRPAAALRQAQLAVAGQKRWADPYYWGGFILQRGR